MTTRSLADAIGNLRRELGDVRAMNKCPSCECFLGVVAQAVADLRRVDSPAAAVVREEFAGWLAEAEGRMRSCQHCEVCVPEGPYRRFREAVEDATGAKVSETAGETVGETAGGSADAGGSTACGSRGRS